MVELLRKQQHHITPDKTEAIKIGQWADAMKDVSQVAGTIGSILGTAGKMEERRQRESEKQAQSDLSSHEKEMQAAVADLRYQHGEDITSDKGQQAVRDRLGEITRKNRPQYEDERTGRAYDEAADRYINQVLDDNILYSTQTKIKRQETERVAQQKAAVNVNAYNQIGSDLIAQAGNLGSYGAHQDVGNLITEVDTDVDKVLAKLPITSAQRAQKKAELYSAMMQNEIIGALSSQDKSVAQEMDLALNNQEKFNQMFSDEVMAPQIEVARNNILNRLNSEKNMLESARMTSSGDRKKEIEKNISDINKQISELTDKNEVDGKNLDDLVRENVRVGLRDSDTIKKVVNRQLGEQALANKLQAFEQQKQFMADSVADPYNPMTQQILDYMASWRGKALQSANPIFKGIGWVAQKLQGAGERPVDGSLASYKPEQWQEMADAYRSYSEKMSNVSQFTESTYTTKADVNAGLFEWMQLRPTNDEGDPTEFQMAGLKFLDKMAGADLTEEERRSYQDFAINAIISDSATVKKQLELLRSGDVGVYAKGGAAGVINYAASDLPLSDTRQGGGISGTRRLYDERASRGTSPETVQNGRTQYANRDFDKYLRRAGAEYVTQAVSMLRNGATEEDVLLMRNQKINKAVSDYYHDYHIVDLAALDKKLEQHQPAYQNIDGVVYEYKGRDSNGLPLWYDHGVLNTNRDFHQLFAPKRMGGTPTVGFGGQIKRSEIGSDMGAKNE